MLEYKQSKKNNAENWKDEQHESHQRNPEVNPCAHKGKQFLFLLLQFTVLSNVIINQN